MLVACRALPLPRWFVRSSPLVILHSGHSGPSLRAAAVEFFFFLSSSVFRLAEPLALGGRSLDESSPNTFTQIRVLFLPPTRRSGWSLQGTVSLSAHCPWWLKSTRWCSSACTCGGPQPPAAEGPSERGSLRASWAWRCQPLLAARSTPFV